MYANIIFNGLGFITQMIGPAIKALAHSLTHSLTQRNKKRKRNQENKEKN